MLYINLTFLLRSLFFFFLKILSHRRVHIIHGQIQNIYVQDLPSRSSLARACKIREAPGKRMINTVKKHSISSQFMRICQSCSCCKSNACLRNTYLPIRQLRAAERVAANTPTVINQGTLFISYKVETRKRACYNQYISLN